MFSANLNSPYSGCNHTQLEVLCMLSCVTYSDTKTILDSGNMYCVVYCKCSDKFALEIAAAAAGVEVSDGQASHEVDENHLQHSDHQIKHRQLEQLLQHTSTELL